MATIELVATILFVLAVLHTFSVKQLAKLSHRFPEGSVGENLFHLLAEVETVFLLWSGILLVFMGTMLNWAESVHFLENVNYTEPNFVFAIMVVAATLPVRLLAEDIIRLIQKFLPLPKPIGYLLATLIVGPLLGSLITEPAAITLTAMLLWTIYKQPMSGRLKYAVLAVLLVNISVGGALTPFAAPPIVVVASEYGWDIYFMLREFGWKSSIVVVVNAAGLVLLFYKELMTMSLDTEEHLNEQPQNGNGGYHTMHVPFWVKLVHLFFLMFIVANSHHTVVFIGALLFFLGFVTVTKEYQERLKIREALLVGGFLAGLVTIGGLQAWWIQQLLAMLGEWQLYVGAVALTGVTDNALLTFLMSLAEQTARQKYLGVAGALAGGGTTVIANAPNPAGIALLQQFFGSDGVSPAKLFVAALLPTIVAAGMFWFF